jgi:hypothetical protein
MNSDARSVVVIACSKHHSVKLGVRVLLSASVALPVQEFLLSTTVVPVLDVDDPFSPPLKKGAETQVKQMSHSVGCGYSSVSL